MLKEVVKQKMITKRYVKEEWKILCSAMWLFTALFCSFLDSLNVSTWNWLLHALIIYVQCYECISSNEPSFRACFSQREKKKEATKRHDRSELLWLIMKFIIFCKYGHAWNLFQSHSMFSSCTLLLPQSVTHTCRIKFMFTFLYSLSTQFSTHDEDHFDLFRWVFQ